jgi:hypothetical protein
MILSLAVVSAVQQIIRYDAASSQLTIKYEFLHNMLVFLFTAVPFHQGGNRYLDETYTTKNISVKRFAGLVDFAFFFAEAVLFYVMSLFIQANEIFYTWVLVIFVIDVLWLGFVFFANPPLFSKTKQWFLLNVGAIIVVSLFLLYHGLDDARKWYLLAFLLVVRTIADYGLSWPFYWPAFAAED